ncbi:MAG: glycosyltransferase family 9 protein [Candidatus Poribacteria bacterium]
MSQKPNRILLIRLSSLGDVVLTSPAIRAARHHFPQAYIAMLVGKQSADVVSENPHLNEIISYNRAGKKNTEEMRRIIHQIRQREFDLTIDFQRKFRTSLLAYLSFAKCRVGYHQPLGILCTVRVPDKVNKHAIDRNLDLLRAIGIHSEDRTLELFISEEDREYAEQFFNSQRISPEHPKIGLFPGAGWRPRQWMPQRFAVIGDLAAEHFGAQVLIFGGAKEMDLVSKVVGYMKSDSIILAGHLKIRQLAALIEQCDVFVTNDTGPMHISVAMKTPTIALFGPGNHKKFQPIGEAHTTIRHDFPCSPCKQFTDKCKDNICMKSISVDEVWQAVKEKLKNWWFHTR